jgi:hypothetical protein
MTGKFLEKPIFDTRTSEPLAAHFLTSLPKIQIMKRNSLFDYFGSRRRWPVDQKIVIERRQIVNWVFSRL